MFNYEDWSVIGKSLWQVEMGKIESMIHHKFELFSNYFVLFLEVFRSVCSLFLKFTFSAKGRPEVPEVLKQKPTRLESQQQRLIRNSYPAALHTTKHLFPDQNLT